MIRNCRQKSDYFTSFNHRTKSLFDKTMVETSPSLVCEGDVAYNSPKLRRGSFTFKRQSNGIWHCIMNYKDGRGDECHVKLEPWALEGVPFNIVEMCQVGAFTICFGNGSYLEYRKAGNYGRVTDLPRIGRLLLALKNSREDSGMHFGSTVHDMFADSPDYCVSDFGGGAAPGNPGRVGCRTSFDKWNGVGGVCHNRHSRSSGGFEGGPKRFDGYRGNRGSQQKKRYSEHCQGYRNYKSSYGSDAQMNHSTNGFHRGRSQYRMQCKTSPLKNRIKRSVENWSRTTAESSENRSSGPRPLKDRGSADNSLERSTSERERGALEQSDGSFDADNEHQAFMSVNNSSTAKLNDRTVHMNGGDPPGNGGILGSRKVVVTKAPDTTPVKNTNPGLAQKRFYGRGMGNTCNDGSPQFAFSAKSVPLKRQSLSSMISPAKKNRHDSEEKENRLSLNGSCQGGRQLDSYGFSNLGNSCYMNAVLQALFCLKGFASDMLHTNEAVKPNPNDNSLYSRVCELLFERMALDPLHATQCYRRLLNNVKEAVNSTISTFRGSKMEDAHEFLTNILEKMSEEIMQANKQTKTPQYNDPIKHFFEYKIIEKSVCTGCSKVVSNAQVLYDIGLPVPKYPCIKSLQSIINSLFKPEKREFNCEHCTNKERLVTTSICTLPRILSIHLKRYKVANRISIKNTNSVRVHKYLTLKQLVGEGVALLQAPVCPSSRFNGTNLETSVDLCSGTIRQSKWHADKEVKSLSEAMVNDGQTKNSELSCSKLENAASVHKGSNKQGLVGGQGPLKDKQANGDEDTAKTLPVATTALTTPQNTDNFQQDFPEIIEDSTEWHNDEDEDLRKAKENSLRTLEEECKTLEERDEMDAVEDDGLLDQIEEENLNGELPHTYQLTSVVCHVGTAERGHYTCCEFDWKKNCFRYYNDDQIIDISEQDFYQRSGNNGYIFFYTHRNLCIET